MPIPSNAFTLHDNSTSSSKLPSTRRAQSKDTTSATAAKISPSTRATMSNGIANGSTSKSTSTSTRRRKTGGIPNGSADLSSVDTSPKQNGNGNGHSHAQTTRHRKSGSKAKARDLTVDVSAKSKANGLAKGSVKATVIDWEIPRKVLHSSIGFLTIGLYTTRSSHMPVVYALSTALGVIVPADVLRLKWPGPGSGFAKLYERLLGFLMRESEKTSSNGVIWYIIGVNFALLVYPLDIAVVSILILSWADTAASTIGRLWGRLTPPLPPQTPILRLPLASRKSFAGFMAATLTGALLTVGFYKYIGPVHPQGLSWTFEHGVRAMRPQDPVSVAVRDVLGRLGWEGFKTGGWAGLALIGVVAGLVSGVAEALDLGGLDDNLTLPIISGGCIWGFFKLLSLFSS